MRYQIISTGNVILADQEFMEANYPGDYTLLPEEVAVVQDPYAWLIDIGPYMDRFGAAKMAVLTSPDVAVKAIVQDMMGRKYIDLQRTDVAQGLAYIGSVVAAVTPALQTTILTTPVAFQENVWLRNTKVFG